MSETKGGACSFAGFVKGELVRVGVELRSKYGFLPSGWLGPSDAPKTTHTIALLTTVPSWLPFACEMKSKPFALSTLSPESLAVLRPLLALFCLEWFFLCLHLDDSPVNIQPRCPLRLVPFGSSLVRTGTSSLWSQSAPCLPLKDSQTLLHNGIAWKSIQVHNTRPYSRDFNDTSLDWGQASLLMYSGNFSVQSVLRPTDVL